MFMPEAVPDVSPPFNRDRKRIENLGLSPSQLDRRMSEHATGASPQILVRLVAWKFISGTAIYSSEWPSPRLFGGVTAWGDGSFTIAAAVAIALADILLDAMVPPHPSP
jgi:hypothetical protein